MQILFFIECFPAKLLSGDIPLRFNPIKLILLIVWVYLCLYSVQRIEFGGLVSKKFKSIVNLFALLLGPIIFLILLLNHAIRKTMNSEQNIFEVIMEQLQKVGASISLPVAVTAKQIADLKLLDSSGRNIKEIYGHGKNKQRDSHILNLTKQIVWDALEQTASDILIDGKDNSTYVVRFRVDGVLREVEQIEADLCRSVINSIKAISNMDIAERRRPQDGAFIAKTADNTISFRVASAGTVNGEKLSIRILSQNTGLFSLENVGLTEKQKAALKIAIDKPSGMILMCGPTGSGKTTTLYGMLNEIDLLTRNVITVEDPIEHVLPNASQIEINPKADITFASSLRSILRQDPDVICIGEIRDEETASIALRASQTGHLVIATIHCNSNAAAIVRLLDLDVTPLLIASGISVLVSQRLLRKLCENCKTPAKLTSHQILDLRRRKINYMGMCQANGCEQCHNTGYHGRFAIFDILIFTEQLKTSVINNTMFLDELRQNGDKKGKSNMYKQGLKKVVSGETTFEELKRVVG